jgi:hypothetical protein
MFIESRLPELGRVIGIYLGTCITLRKGAVTTEHTKLHVHHIPGLLEIRWLNTLCSQPRDRRVKLAPRA